MAQPEERSPWPGILRRMGFMVVVAGLGLLGARALDNARRDSAGVMAASASAAPIAAPRPAPAKPAEPRWLAIGGGVDPVSNQVSIEQNLALITDVLGKDQGILLYAGGIARSPVHELGPPNDEAPALHDRLGRFFDPRDGRSARYRPTVLAPHGPADARAAEEQLVELLEASDRSPLLLVVVAHGEAGSEARANRVPLWGGGALKVGRLAERMDALERPRPLRAVVTTCFSGGFGELVFRNASGAEGPTSHDRCGIFAATWDTEASGCDPNPDRRAQEGYALHVFRALEGKDRDGKPDASIDRDGDGQVSLLEAHAQARIASLAFSVPTSTTERWLAQVAPPAGPSEPVDLPEEDAVIESLSAQLGLMGESAARAHHEARAKTGDLVDEELGMRERKTDEAFRALRIALLERWPMLDDPYHPSYRATLEAEGGAIASFLDEGAAALRYLAAAEAEAPLRQRLDDIEVDLALTERLVRAHVIRAAAGRLRAEGGAGWEVFQRLLACERWVPAR